MQLEAAVEERPDGAKTVWTGEVDPFYRMKGMALKYLEQLDSAYDTLYRAAWDYSYRSAALCLGRNRLHAAQRLDKGYCFPSRIDDIAILENAARIHPDGEKAYYYLGRLYYDRFGYEKEMALWERAVQINPRYGKAF